MKIVIKETFESAWRMFNWKKKVWGVGLNKEIVDNAGNKVLEVDVNKNKYVIGAKDVAKYGNPYEVKGGIRLYVVPEYLLRKIL